MPEVKSNYDGNVQYYSVSTKECSIYKSSKTPIDGYKKIEDTDKVYYHKYLKSGLMGKLTYLAVEDREFSGRKVKQLKMMLAGDPGEDTSALTITVKNSNGLTKEIKAFIKSFYHYDFDEKNLIIRFYGKPKPDGNGKYLNCYVEYTSNGERPEYLDTKDTPRGVKKDVAGDITWDYSDQDERYFNKLMKLMERWDAHRIKNTEDNTEIEESIDNIVADIKSADEISSEDKKKETKKTSKKESDDEQTDLPF